GGPANVFHSYVRFDLQDRTHLLSLFRIDSFFNHSKSPPSEQCSLKKWLSIRKDRKSLTLCSGLCGRLKCAVCFPRKSPCGESSLKRLPPARPTGAIHGHIPDGTPRLHRRPGPSSSPEAPPRWDRGGPPLRRQCTSWGTA